MTHEMDPLAIAFAEAAPYISDGRDRLLSALDKAFVHHGEAVAQARSGWTLVRSDEKQSASLRWSPAATGRALFDIRWDWDDNNGATLTTNVDPGGLYWFCSLTDSGLHAQTAAFNAAAAELRADLHVTTGLHGALPYLLHELCAKVEAGFVATADQDRLAALSEREPYVALFTGRCPPQWAMVRHGLARAVWRAGRWLELRFVADDSTPEASGLDPSSVDIIIAEAPGDPAPWLSEASGFLQECMDAGVLVVAIGDWIHAAGWNRAGFLLDLLPVTIDGAEHKSGKWDGALPFSNLTLATRSPLDLGFLVNAPITVGGAVRCVAKQGATTLLEGTRADGTHHPFVSLMTRGRARCLWMASGTGGWGKSWSQSGRPWEQTWERIVDFAGASQQPG